MNMINNNNIISCFLLGWLGGEAERAEPGDDPVRGQGQESSARTQSDFYKRFICFININICFYDFTLYFEKKITYEPKK